MRCSGLSQLGMLAFVRGVRQGPVLEDSARSDLHPTGQPLTHTGMLIACIMYSAVISVVAGFVCASVKKESPMKTVWVFALIQLAVGIFVEYTYWDLMPAWYHIVFLVLIVPATVWGGSQKKDDSVATA